MKCVDCLSEIDDKEYYNRSCEGVCKKCRQKRAQIKYENKKNGTNKEYVPARLKTKTRAKRKTTTIAKKRTSPVIKKVEEDKSKLYGKEIEEKVNKDITSIFSTYGVEIKANDRLPFLIFMNMFESLLDVKNGFMRSYLKAEELFNKMERDYQHAFEDAKTIEEMDERGKMFRCFLDKRRDVKNINIQYEQISRILYEINDQIPDILDKVHLSTEKLADLVDKQEKHCYKAEVSELVQEADFCTGSKSIGKYGMKKYDVSVPLFNYGNNCTGIPFDFHRFAYARNEEDAIGQIKAFLLEKFPTCTYKPNDFLAVELFDDIVTTGKEVCL